MGEMLAVAVVFDAGLAVAALALLPYYGYQLLVVIAALASGCWGCRRATSPGLGLGGPGRRLLIVIPAHDEQDGINETVRSCLACDYPRELFDVLVIADNCTDGTAAVAARAGARVFERVDETRRSKGYAIEDLVDRLRESGEWAGLDALVIIDADSVVDPGILRAFAAGLDAGHEWIQGYDAVGNADASWRTRLMAYAFSLINGTTLHGQAALGVGAALRGNGMCLSTVGLDRVPWRATGLVEDLEYSWKVRTAGGRIGFDCGAVVVATMLVGGGRASENQRLRWERGRRAQRGRMIRPLLASPYLGPLRKAALLLELTMPTTVTLAIGYLAFGLVAAWRIPRLLEDHEMAWLVPTSAFLAVATLMFGAMTVSPFALGLVPARYALALLHFPQYAAWKLLLVFRPSPTSWVRTEREPRRSVS